MTVEPATMETAPPAGAVPVFQFEPIVQSLLAAPVHVCAAADRGNSTERAATDALINRTDLWN